MDWHEFLLVAGAHFAAVASPGPDFAVVTKVALKHGRRAGIFTSLGVANGILVHILYCLVGFALLIKNTEWLFAIIKYGGAAYLLWIAYNAIKGAWSGFKARAAGKSVANQVTEISAAKAWKQGFVTNVTNPKATLFFLVIFTEVISSATPLWARGVYGAEMVVATGAWFSLVAWLINRRGFRKGYDRASWAIDGLLGLILLILVVRIVL